MGRTTRAKTWFLVGLSEMNFPDKVIVPTRRRKHSMLLERRCAAGALLLCALLLSTAPRSCHSILLSAQAQQDGASMAGVSAVLVYRFDMKCSAFSTCMHTSSQNAIILCSHCAMMHACMCYTHFVSDVCMHARMHPHRRHWRLGIGQRKCGGARCRF